MEKCGNIEIEKHKFHQYKRPTSIKNTDINTIDYLIRPLLVKKGFKYFIGYNDAKKLDLYGYFFQK